MPPFRFKDPKPVYLKAGRGRIVPLAEPDVKLGRSLVANAPARVQAVHLETTRALLRKFLGKRTEIRYNVFATFPVSKKPPGTGMNQGKGDIDHFIARVPAGRTIVHLPGWNSPFISAGFGYQKPVQDPFRKVAQMLPIPVTLRSQNNIFPMDRFDLLTKKKLQAEAEKKLIAKQLRLKNPNVWEKKS